MVSSVLSIITKLLNDENKKKTFFNFFFLGLERLTQLLVIVIINKLLINNYSFGDFSSWQYALVIFAIFMTGTWICGSEVVIPKLLDYPDRIDKIISNVIFLRLGAGIFVAFAMIIWAIVTANGLNRVFIIGLAVSVAFREVMIVGLTWYQSLARLKLPCQILILASLLKLLVVYIGVKIHLPIDYLWIAWVIESLLPCCFIFYFFKKATNWKLVKVDSSIFELLKLGLAVWFCLCMQQLTMKFDRVFLEGKITGEMYSNYTAALQLVDNWYAICILFVQAIAPIFIFKYSNIREIKENLKFCIFATLVVTSIGALASTLFADLIINVFYGSKLLHSSGYLSLFIWLTPVLAIDQVLSMVLIRTKQLKKLILKWLCSFLYVLIFIPVIYHFYGVRNIFWSLFIIYGVNILFSVRCIKNAR
ncbi:O45 family O-antigen flippase [Vagococcus sp. WN89Y]|uniref:O45 family O-antigen flippase n=1 Tax=Vagococcus sp. WN89Y TaxID=3457258 RepID=UPI003FCDF5C0